MELKPFGKHPCGPTRVRLLLLYDRHLLDGMRHRDSIFVATRFLAICNQETNILTSMFPHYQVLIALLKIGGCQHSTMFDQEGLGKKM